MTIKFLKVLIGLLLLIVSATQAQTLTGKNSVEIEVDPIAYILKGYSVHLVYNHSHLRYDVGVFGLEQPDFLSGNKNFRAMSSGVGFKINYLFKPLNSFYTGIDLNVGKTKVTSDLSGDTDTNHDVAIGAHAGYRFFVFQKRESFLKGFYLTPWVGISYDHFYDKVKFKDYKEESIAYFATVHIGYRFK